MPVPRAPVLGRCIHVAVCLLALGQTNQFCAVAEVKNADVLHYSGFSLSVGSLLLKGV